MTAPLDLYKQYLPNALITDDNQAYFDYVERMFYAITGLYNSYTEALPLMAVIQSEGGWMDIIGTWAGIKRPNVAFRELADGEVLFQNEGPTDPAFNAEHSLSTDNPGGVPGPVTDTFFPSIFVTTEALMNDEEYSELIIAFQRLKFNGDTLPNVKAVLDALLSRPYTLTAYIPGERVQFQVAPDEAFGRFVAVQTLFEKISGDGIIYVVST